MRVAGLCGLGLLALTTSSFAADLPILRGSMAPPLEYAAYYPWTGFYIGAQGGFSGAGVDFSDTTEPLLSYILRESTLESRVRDWALLEKKSTTGGSFGGFIGYNWQWDDAVLGIEVNYSHFSLNADAAGSLGPLRYIDNTNAPSGHTYIYTVASSANASVALTDLATIRGRAGWAAGPVLPYAFGGLAIGRADVLRNATVTATRTDIYTVGDTEISTTNGIYFPEPTKSESQKGYFGYGYTVGAGVDWALLPNFLLRAEYEFVGFSDFYNTQLYLNTVRAGAALKF